MQRERLGEILPQLTERIAAKNLRGVKELIEDLLPADALEVIQELGTTERVVVFRILPKRVAAEVFTELPPDQQAELLELFSDKQTAELFEQMDPDDRAEVLEEFPAGVVKDLLRVISPSERAMTAALLGYPENSAGRIMTPEFVDLRADMTVEEAIARIRRVGPDKETIYVCYVISPHRHLKGTVSLREILLAPADKRIEELMHPEPVTVHTRDDQEEVAATALRYDLLAVPVVDAENRLVGIVTVDDLLEVVEEEVSEDVYRMAGMEELPETYFDTRFITLFRRRFIWLLVLMAGQTIAGSILKHFEATLTAVVALVFFIPMLVGSAGSSGTQSATLMIRGLAVGDIDMSAVWRVLLRESLMGLLLGALLGIAGGAIAVGMGGDPRLFAAVGLAFICTILTANVVGAFLPLLAKRIRWDPAVMAGPFITTVVDFTGLVIYFQIARAVFNL